MDIVNDLIRRRAACEQEIAEQDRKIQEYERAYESLRRFDGAVDTAQSNFHNVNTVKLNRTSELSSITSRCRTAQLYLEGSQRTLNGFGAKIVGAAFTGLDVMIRLKLAEYRLKIQNCENRISSLERSIDSINSMIDTARILPGRRMRVGIRKKTFWKRTFAVFLASVCLWSAAGCTGAGTGMDREDEKVSTELTQRQRELLEEMGLPADYDKLTDTQKNAVTSIEAMLSYLESKYQEEFCYLSYAEAGTLEKEHLEAYPASGTPSDVVTVYRTYEDGEYHYEDDYGNIGVRPLYESRVREFAVQSFPESGIKVFSDIRNLGQGTDGQSVTEENVLQTASAVTYIFISESVCTEAQLRDFTEECAQWMESQCQGVAAQICLRLTDAAQWELIDATGYEDKLRAFRQGYGLLTEEMIMYLTDEQIMLLEQLTYLTDDVADAAGVLLGPYDSVEDLLQQFDDDALQRLEDPGNPDSTKDYTGGKKWAAIIRQIKSDPDLYSLDIVNKDDSVPAICFNDPDDPEHAGEQAERMNG